MTLALGLLSTSILVGFASANRPRDDDGITFFETRIRPLLADNCYECHGPEASKSGLRLDSAEGILRGSSGGSVIEAGHEGDIPLLFAVSYEDTDLRMPPRGKLADTQIEDLRRWLEMGAPLPDEQEAASRAEVFDLEARLEHWSYNSVSKANPPTVTDPEWAQQDLDRFVLAKLEEAGLSPAPVADRRTWIRRVSFDLTGLPPTRDDVAAFVADDSDDAHAHVVERLLASPQFGVRWARTWLDLVGYADTRGHEFDYPLPNAYQYRDYIVRAFNLDLPYDELLIEHIAGDLLPSPRAHPENGGNESVLGTGWWWLGEEVHSPVSTKADQADRIAVRMDVLGRGFLGQSIACARCHDHRFDPISQRDYYALAGYMRSGSYRQVRFETEAHNSAIAQQIENVRSTFATRLSTEAAHELAQRHARADRYMMAAHRLSDSMRGQYPAAKLSELLTEADVLFEDFEGYSWGEWKTEGTAFANAPRHVVKGTTPGATDGTLPEGVRGSGFCDSRGAASGQSATGVLTSPSFTIDRDYIHFLVGGHDGSGAFVQLLVDEEVIETAHGTGDDKLRHKRFDVRKQRGRQAQLLVHDSSAEDGHFARIDHIVFSDDEGSAALNTTLKSVDLERSRSMVKVAAAWQRLDAEALTQWIIELDGAARDALHPLYLFARLAGEMSREHATESATFTSRLLALCEELEARELRANETADKARLVHDFTVAPEGALLQNGFAFRSEEKGSLAFGSSARPIEGIASRPSAVMDPLWRRLRTAGESEGHPGALNWLQAGRMLRTPTFGVETGKLYYLVRGAGSVYAAIDQHRLVNGPLHGSALRHFDTAGRWQWISHDLSRYTGHHVHFEFSPKVAGHATGDIGGGSAFAVALLVESETKPELPSAWIASNTARITQQTPGDLAALACHYADQFASVAQRWIDTPDRRTTLAQSDLQLLDWLLRSHELQDSTWATESADGSSSALASSEPGSALRVEYVSAMRAFVEQIRDHSRIALAMQEGTANDAPFLVRGNPRTASASVPRRMLTALGAAAPHPKEVGSGRLALARDLARADNPFFTRVIVNRLWHHLFGRGIVASVDDFGAMGTPPSHPQLLDHLANRLVEQDFSIKSMLRELTLSSTYRQSSRSTAKADQVDEQNLLLHEMPVRRLPAEAIRDSVLAVSGGLDPALHGKPVPVHLTAFMQGRGRPGASGPLDGKGRRSLYLSVRRNFLVPLFMVFDFPSPATCSGRRSISNVPAQALALMNDPFIAGQARRWAESSLAASDCDAEARVIELYETAFARSPESHELAAALEFIVQESARLADPEQSVSAWADLCHILLNVKEFIFLD